MACITSMDADHLDIYGDKASIEATFVEFADKVENKNLLFIPKNLPLEGIKIAINEEADFTAFNIRVENSAYVFDVKTPSETIKNIQFNLPGRHNLMNALMALAMAITYGSPTNSIVRALGTFKGIKRRFSYQIKQEKLVFIDDYAHHPTEINAVHQAVRELYPQQKVLAVFQPHLFTRTRDFFEGFVAQLSRLDEVILLPIYPAREEPIPGVTSDALLEKITAPDKKLMLPGEAVTYLSSYDQGVFLTIGAGDIDRIVNPLKRAWSE